jgi:hypothetical protein
MNKLMQRVIRDLAAGRASIEVNAFPTDIRELFMPEEKF